MPNHLTAYNHAGHAWIVQTENPKSAHLHSVRNHLPRSKKAGAVMAETFGGAWRYVPGSGCRGGWSVEASSVEELAKIIEATGIPATMFVYPETIVPEVFKDCDAFAHNPATGYYDLKVAG